jgi:acetylglutamate kinase
VRVKRVIFLTNTNGILDANNQTVKWGDISSQEQKDYFYSFVKQDGKSKNGTGGMRSKIQCAFDVLDNGVSESIIASANSWPHSLYYECRSTHFTKDK